MALTPGNRLGAYEIVALLGSGGMGEVYRARDSRLNRDVAIKVLPPGFADDPDRRARFEREAQAVAALSHPNIVAIHDTGLHQSTTDGKPALFVVMELLAGQTLRDRLNVGALPVRKAVEIGVQIARGLGAAHGKGLVHRDLKPENVFLLDDGQVKILDFGLARQARASEHSGATQTIAMTDPGTVMGTVGYMAPEQVRGQQVDARADVFAFGAVLHEMIGGTRAFQRETAADTMTAILTQDPPELAGSRPDFPPSLDRIIRHCLEKNPNERFQSARDIAFALESLSGSGSAATSTQGVAVPDPTRERRGLSPVVTGVLVVAALAAGVFGTTMLQHPATSQAQFIKKTFEPQSIFNGRFMPDGQTIVFSSALTGDRPHLFEIRSGTLEAMPFGPPDTHLLSVSSKGELAVLTDAVHVGHRLFKGTLSRMSREGAPRPWLENVREADWNPDGTTLAVIRVVNGRDQLEYPIGTKLYEAKGYISDPRVSPDGRRVAFMEHPMAYDDRGYVKVIDEAKNVTTLAGEFWGTEGTAWAPDGSSLHFSASPIAADTRSAGQISYQIYSVPADGRQTATLEMTTPGDMVILDIAADGRWLTIRDEMKYGIAARGAGQKEERDLSWLDKSWTPYLSHDGLNVVFGNGNAGPDYSVTWRKADGSPIVQLGDGDPRGWSKDGKSILGLIPSSARLVLYAVGAGDPRPIPTDPVTHVLDAGWMPDSKSVYFLGSEPGKPARYFTVPVAGGAVSPILPADVIGAMFAPNGEFAIGTTAAGVSALYPLAGGPSRPIPGLTGTDEPLAISEDSMSVFTPRAGHRVPLVVDRIDIGTGTRTQFGAFAPADRAGLVKVQFSTRVIKADGSEYVYGYSRKLSVLFVAERAAK